MIRWKAFVASVSFSVFLVDPAVACEIDISGFVGWTIVYSGTVTGYIDENGRLNEDFEGCEYDRVLIIDDDKAVTCAEYNYSYAYRPDIVILSDGYSMKACINDEVYDVRK